MREVHPDLTADAWITRWIGVPLMGVMAAGAMAGAVSAAVEGAPRGLVALLGFIAVLFIWVVWMVWRSAAWYERATWVLHQTEPLPVTLSFGTNVESWPTVSLFPLDGASPGWYMLCRDSPPNQTALVGATAQAHIDPVSGGPIVLRTEFGLIWPLLGPSGRIRAKQEPWDARR